MSNLQKKLVIVVYVTKIRLIVGMMVYVISAMIGNGERLLRSSFIYFFSFFPFFSLTFDCL